jgi:hypothetical protein
MKKISLVLLVWFGIGMAMNAVAEEVSGVTIDGKKIVIVEADKKFFSQEHFLHSKDLQDGIYAIAVSGPGSLSVYPNATAIIRERIVANGFKVVDKAEGSAVGLKFFTTGSLDMEDADKAAAASNLPNSGQIGSNVIGGLGAIAVAGIAGGAAYAIGSLFQSSKETVIGCMGIAKPLSNKMNESSEKEATIFNAIMYVDYKLEKDNKASDDIVLKMLVDQWIKRYLVLDTEPVAVSAVTHTETLAAEKH